MSDSTYFYILGIVTSVIVVAMVLFVSWVKRTARKAMRFFEPTRVPAKPATEKGPSPARVLFNSLIMAIELLAVVVAVVLFVYYVI